MKNSMFILAAVLIYSSTYALPLPVHTLKNYECTRCDQLSHESLHDQWNINKFGLDSVLNNKQQSYGYRQQVSAQELNAGIPIHLRAPGAIIRISPINNNELQPLFIKTHDKKTIPLRNASSLYAENEPNAFGSNHQTLAQINTKLGKGTFILSSSIAVKKTNTYMISVFDKFSLDHLDIETESLHYQYGETVQATITLNDPLNRYEVKDVEAYLVSPAGQLTSMNVKEININQFAASIPLTSESADNGENWYIKASLETKSGEETMKRHVQTAFSYSIPSATLHQITLVSKKPLTFKAKIEVATASRYSLQSVLFKKNNKAFDAVRASQASLWLKPGTHSVEFTFDNSQHLAEDNLYLGYLRIVDYGQLKQVYRYDKPMQLSTLVD